MTLTTGQLRTDVDFGYQPTYAGGSLGGTVWKDLNGDQVQLGLSEHGLANVTVTEKWVGQWRLGGESGTLRTLQTTGTIANFPVQQIQAVIGR